jgi:septum formation protein
MAQGHTRSPQGDAAAADDAQLVLASASPRRLALLQALGIRVRQRAADIDERARPEEAADALVLRLAQTKARAGLAPEATCAGLPVLGADTVVVLDDVVLGKPVDRADGLRMLMALSGREHEVLTAVAVAVPEGVQVRLSRSRVSFREIAPDEADRYWQTGEPIDKAGGYGIQGVGGIFVERLDGSFSGVMGLPVAETEALLSAAGVDCWRHRAEAGARAQGAIEHPSDPASSARASDR